MKESGNLDWGKRAMAVNVVSLFSGGGGLDLGFQSAGFQIIWAIDNNQNAVDTYKANIGEHIICEDINKVDTKKIPFADVIIGVSVIFLGR
jgi:DNA (cytosine-5)-methyltransferase 1